MHFLLWNLIFEKSLLRVWDKVWPVGFVWKSRQNSNAHWAHHISIVIVDDTATSEEQRSHVSWTANSAVFWQKPASTTGTYNILPWTILYYGIETSMLKCRMCSLEILAQAVQQRGVDLRIDPTLLEECVIDAKIHSSLLNGLSQYLQRAHTAF